MAKRTKRVHGEWAPSLPFTDKAFRPYAWPSERLPSRGTICTSRCRSCFESILSVGNFNMGPFQAIWQKITNDRMQRNVLVAVAKEATLALASGAQFEDIKWLCDQATNLEDFRNDALHSPLWGIGTQAGPDIAPVTGLGHPRATKLYGKDLLAEFRLCRDSITTLRNYAMQIDECLQRRHGVWPKRPKMPRRPSVPTDPKR